MNTKVKVLIKWGISIVCLIWLLARGGSTEISALPAVVFFGLGIIWAIPSILRFNEGNTSGVMLFLYICVSPIIGWYHAIIDTVSAFLPKE